MPIYYFILEACKFITGDNLKQKSMTVVLHSCTVCTKWAPTKKGLSKALPLLCLQLLNTCSRVILFRLWRLVRSLMPSFLWLFLVLKPVIIKTRSHKKIFYITDLLCQALVHFAWPVKLTATTVRFKLGEFFADVNISSYSNPIVMTHVQAEVAKCQFNHKCKSSKWKYLPGEKKCTFIGWLLTKPARSISVYSNKKRNMAESNPLSI